MDTVRYGVIGCGVIGPVHMQAISAQADARLVGVCDCVPARARQAQAQYGAAVMETDYHALLAREDIDAVCICTPHYLHAEMTIAAARAGKHVLCEKPMALDPAEMDAMIAAAEQAGVQLGICFQHRFDPAVVQLREMIDAGQFGRLLIGGAHLRCLRDANYYNSATWRGTWAYEGGGVLINQAIHTIDLMCWLLGTAVSVQGHYALLEHGAFIEVEDTASGTVTFANGAVGNIAATSASHLEWHSRLHIFGTAGSAAINTGFPVEFTFLERTSGSPLPAPPPEELPGVGKACYGNSHIRASAAFTQALRTNTPFPITGRDGRQAAEVVLGLYRASRAQGPVSLPLQPARQGVAG